MVQPGCVTPDLHQLLRFYGLCLAEYREDTVCRKDRIPGADGLMKPSYSTGAQA